MSDDPKMPGRDEFPQHDRTADDSTTADGADHDSSGGDYEDQEFDRSDTSGDWSGSLFTERESEEPFQFRISSALLVIAAAALLFMVERQFAPGGRISLTGIVLAATAPLVIAYCMAANWQMAVNMLVTLYAAALFCRVTGWSTPQMLCLMLSLSLAVYSAGIHLGSAARIDLHAPWIGIPLIALLLVLAWCAHVAWLDPEAETSAIAALVTIGVAMPFAVSVVFRLLGLD